MSEDGQAALVNVAFTQPRLKLSDETKNAVIEHFEPEPIDGVEVSFSTDLAQGVPKIFGIGEVVGVAFAALILLVMLGSVLAAPLPLITALVGVAISALGALAFSGVVQMASVTPVLAIMLGLANGTAGNAVVFAGTTVIVALLALNITGVPFLGLMGTVGALAVLVALLISISLTPRSSGSPDCACSAAGPAHRSARSTTKIRDRSRCPPGGRASPYW